MKRTVLTILAFVLALSFIGCYDGGNDDRQVIPPVTVDDGSGDTGDTGDDTTVVNLFEYSGAETDFPNVSWARVQNMDASGVVPARVTDYAFNGSYSVKLNRDEWYSLSLNSLTPGTTYKLEVWVQVPVLDPTHPEEWTAFKFIIVQDGSTNAELGRSNSITSGNTWIKLEVEFTATDNTTFISFPETTHNDAYYDDFSLTVVE